MKFKLTFLAFSILTIQAYSQSKNSLSIVYGTTSNTIDIHNVIGDFGYFGKGGTVYGLSYERGFNKSFSVETGLTFSNDKVQLNSVLPGHGTIQPDEIKMLSVPLLAKYTLLKYGFIEGGLLADFQTNTPNNSTTSKQSGVGYELGLGVQYHFPHVNIFVKPYVQEHAVITFNSAPYTRTFNLLDAGFKFGLGYSF